MTTVGRIAEDWESASTSDLKLLPATMVIEPSRGTGSGVRVPLRFADDVRVRGAPKGAGGIGVFPGAVVGLRGKNGGGDWFLVEEMLAVSFVALHCNQAPSNSVRSCFHRHRCHH